MLNPKSVVISATKMHCGYSKEPCKRGLFERKALYIGLYGKLAWIRSGLNENCKCIQVNTVCPSTKRGKNMLFTDLNIWTLRVAPLTNLL